MSNAPAAAPQRSPTSNYNREKVLTVHHWTDTLFTFTTTRDPSFRFVSGQFAMIGLEVDGKPLVRAYSMASAHYEEDLEFFSIKVQNGPLTSRLQHLKVGDEVLVGRKPTGTLLLENLLPGKRLYMLSTGTGLAPFMSLIKDPETYERFDQVILTHTCRHTNELAYGDFITRELPKNELFGELVAQKLRYYSTVTRDAFHQQGRITDLIRSGKLFTDLGVPPLSRADDRLMLCGSPEMLSETRTLLTDMGYLEGNMSEPGEFVIEKAFVER